MEAKRISLVIPAFNEAGNIEKCVSEIDKHLSQYNYQILFVDDGSKDDTLKELRKISSANSKVHYLSLSRNFGHQNALRAGLESADGDCVISLDADLQHPPELIPEMIKKWEEGYDVVQTIRKGNKKLPLFKRFTSGLFYKFLNGISEVKIESGAADFRLLDRRIVDIIKDIKDPMLFLRGLVPWLGFRQTSISFTVGERHSGESKYTFKKMFRLALDGIMSFSIKPLRTAIVFGFIMSSIAFVYGLYALGMFLFTDQVVSGWTSLVLSIVFMGGIQLLFLGIIGEYLGKLFISVKQRPNYLIKESSLDND